MQLRLVLARDEHVDDIVVEEDEGRIVAFAAVCSPTIGGHPEQMEGPFTSTSEPLGERKVIDAFSGRPLPYRNVLAELAEEYGLNGNEQGTTWTSTTQSDSAIGAYGVETRW